MAIQNILNHHVRKVNHQYKIDMNLVYISMSYSCNTRSFLTTLTHFSEICRGKINTSIIASKPMISTQFIANVFVDPVCRNSQHTPHRSRSSHGMFIAYYNLVIVRNEQDEIMQNIDFKDTTNKEMFDCIALTQKILILLWFRLTHTDMHMMT